MPIIDRGSRNVDVNPVTGQHHGVMVFTFADGRVREAVSMKAADSAAWDARLASLEPEILAQVQLEDSEEDIEEDVEIVEHKEASLGQRVLAKLRRAALLKDRIKAAKMFVRIRDYLVANIPGINRNKIRNHLLGLGMSNAEWARIELRYDHLTDPAHVATMQAMQTIINDDPSAEEIENQGL